MRKILVIIFSLIISAVALLSSCGTGDNIKESPETTFPAATDSKNSPSEATSEPQKNHQAIKKIQVVSDDQGIYSTVITLSDKNSDKGVVEMEYTGEKGSPQENTIICTFKIEYSKNSDGTYNIHTYFNGEVYQNYNNKDVVKVTNTFGASMRAGSIKVTYTPEGGSSEVVFTGNAEEFR